MASDCPPRPRSPITSRETVTYRPSPFFAPPGWQPLTTRAHSPGIIQIDLHLCSNWPCVTLTTICLHLKSLDFFTSGFDGLFTLYKVIYLDYRFRHCIEEIENLVIATFSPCWAICLNSTDFYLMLPTPSGPHVFNNPIGPVLWMSSSLPSRIRRPASTAALARPRITSTRMLAALISTLFYFLKASHGDLLCCRPTRLRHPATPLAAVSENEYALLFGHVNFLSSRCGCTKFFNPSG